MSLRRGTGNQGLLEAPEQLKVVGYNRGRWIRVLSISIVVLLLAFVVRVVTTSRGDSALRRVVSGAAAPASLAQRDFVDDYLAFRDWIDRRGFQLEVDLFDRTADTLYSALRAQGRPPSESVARFLYGAYGSALAGALRAAFVLIACSRLWLVALLVGAALGYRALRVHRGNDFLGVMGNGRPFYSGIRAGLGKRASNGAPDQQIVGLACPAMSDAERARNSELGKLLERWEAMNEINLALVQIIVEHQTMPAFVAAHGEHQFLERQFEGQALIEHASQLVQGALALQAQYKAEHVSDPEVQFEFPQPQDLSARHRLSALEYAGALERAMHRCLTPRMRHDIAGISRTHLVTPLLALQAAKSMVYAREGGAWGRRSNFLQLSARAVLHSLPAYGAGYDFATREMVRRALIFGARRSVYGPVRFVTDLSAESYALRQWVELALACPHEIVPVQDEVELFGIVLHAHEAWSKTLIDSMSRGSGEFAKTLYASTSGSLFIPLHRVVAMMRRLMGPAQIKRLEDLVQNVGQRQRIETLSRALGSAEQLDRGAPPPYERLFAPLTTEQVMDLSREHDLDPEDIREWSTLRAVFNAYGWLTRRIGDNTVPESSLVHLALRGVIPLPGANELGLVAVSGMVPFRGTRLRDLWGKEWHMRCKPVDSVVMAERRDELQRIMAGLEPAGVIDGVAMGDGQATV